MQLSYKDRPHNQVDYYSLPSGLVDVFLHKNEVVELDEDDNKVFIAEETYFQVNKNTTKKDIEENFNLYWENKGGIEPTELSQGERISIRTIRRNVKMSRLYPFILNMWVMGKDEDYVNNALRLKYITQDEKEIILATPQLR